MFEKGCVPGVPASESPTHPIDWYAVKGVVVLALAR